MGAAVCKLQQDGRSVQVFLWICGVRHKIGAAMSIETPLTDQIFKAQGMTDEAIMWLWIMIGRLFTPAHKHDGWGTGLMIWGFAGEWHIRTLTTIETINHTNHQHQPHQQQHRNGEEHAS